MYNNYQQQVAPVQQWYDINNNHYQLFLDDSLVSHNSRGEILSQIYLTSENDYKQWYENGDHYQLFLDGRLVSHNSRGEILSQTYITSRNSFQQRIIPVEQSYDISGNSFQQ